MNNDRKFHPSATDTTALDAGRIAIGTKEAAQRLGVSRNTLYMWVHAGKVPHKRVGGHIMFSLKRLQEWVAGADDDVVPAGTFRA